MQHKSDRKLYPPYFERVERLRNVKNLTWQGVADVLGLSVGMLMMVKSGRRNLSKKALFRLAEAEKKAFIFAEISRPYPTILALQAAPRMIEQSFREAEIDLKPTDIERGYFDFPLQYKRGEPAKGMPRVVRLHSPKYQAAQAIHAAIKADADMGALLIDCLPKKWLKASLPDMLTPFCVRAMMKVCAALVFGVEGPKLFELWTMQADNSKKADREG